VQQYLRQIHSLFAEQTQIGHHLLSIQPGLSRNMINDFLHRWLLHFCILTVIFDYVNFRNLLGLMVQFTFVLMHILNNSWCDRKCTDVTDVTVFVL